MSESAKYIHFMTSLDDAMTAIENSELLESLEHMARQHCHTDKAENDPQKPTP